MEKNDYKRITIPKGIWFAFQGVSKNLNLLLNISNIVHDPNECEILPLNHEKFKNINFIKVICKKNIDNWWFWKSWQLCN